MCVYLQSAISQVFVLLGVLKDVFPLWMLELPIEFLRLLVSFISSAIFGGLSKSPERYGRDAAKGQGACKVICQD